MRFFRPIQVKACFHGGSSALAVLALAAVAAVPASAQTAATLTTPGTEYDGSPYTLGFSFTVNQAINVTSLGVYDSGADGLADAAQVGIWNLTGTLLTSTTVPTGTGGTLENGFRYASISPLVLTPGTTYVVGAYLNDMASSLNTGQGGAGFFDSALNVIEDRYITEGAFAFPTTTNGNAGGGWLGANFRFAAVTAAPEPASLALLALAGLPVVGLIRRKRK